MRANQLRLWFASAAYVLLCVLRRIGHTMDSVDVRLCRRFSTVGVRSSGGRCSTD